MHEGDEGHESYGECLRSHNSLLKLGLKALLDSHPWIRLIEHCDPNSNLEDILSREPFHILIVDTDSAGDVPTLI